MTNDTLIDRPRVLIVGSEASVRDLLCDTLSETYEVRGAATAEYACTVLERECVNVVLLNYHLIGGNSDAVARLADAKRVPVIWTTGDPEASAPSR